MSCPDGREEMGIVDDTKKKQEILLCLNINRMSYKVLVSASTFGTNVGVWCIHLDFYIL